MRTALYPYGRVQSIESLRHPLGLGPAELERLANRASQMYFEAKRELKDDGSERILFDTRPPLQAVLQRININFLRRVRYTDYLTGGVPGKDYESSVTFMWAQRRSSRKTSASSTPASPAPLCLTCGAGSLDLVPTWPTS